MKDWKCRNCGFRFTPTLWVLVSSQNDMAGQCPRCQSNATHEIGSSIDADYVKEVQYETPKTTDGRIRLDE